MPTVMNYTALDNRLVMGDKNKSGKTIKEEFLQTSKLYMNKYQNKLQINDIAIERPEDTGVDVTIILTSKLASSGGKSF